MDHITLNWHDDDKTMIDIHFSAGWTWEEYSALVSTVAKMKTGISHHVIHFNYNLDGYFPKSSAMPHLARMQRTHDHDHMTMVIVSEDATFRHMVAILMNSVGLRENKNFFVFSDVATAKQFAAKRLAEMNNTNSV